MFYLLYLFNIEQSGGPHVTAACTLTACRRANFSSRSSASQLRAPLPALWLSSQHLLRDREQTLSRRCPHRHLRTQMRKASHFRQRARHAPRTAGPISSEVANSILESPPTKRGQFASSPFADRPAASITQKKSPGFPGFRISDIESKYFTRAG